MACEIRRGFILEGQARRLPAYALSLNLESHPTLATRLKHRSILRIGIPIRLGQKDGFKNKEEQDRQAGTSRQGDHPRSKDGANDPKIDRHNAAGQANA